MGLKPVTVRISWLFFGKYVNQKRLSEIKPTIIYIFCDFIPNARVIFKNDISSDTYKDLQEWIG